MRTAPMFLSKAEAAHVVPFGPLAPGLINPSPGEMDELLQTGDYVGYIDFGNACTSLALGHAKGTRAFNSLVGHLVVGESTSLQTNIRYGLQLCFKPNEGIRTNLVVATQRITGMITEHEAGVFDDPPHVFTAAGWDIMAEVLRDEGFDPWMERF